MIIYCSMLLRTRNVSDKSCREHQNTYFMFNKFFWKACHLWDNAEKYGTARQGTYVNTIWHMHFACWITKAADTIRTCNTYCFYTPTMVTWKRLNVMFKRTFPVFLKHVTCMESYLKTLHIFKHNYEMMSHFQLLECYAPNPPVLLSLNKGVAWC